MPKMKTKRGAAKRFKLTGTGKVKAKRAGLRHILTGKSKAAKRTLRKPGIVAKADTAAVKKMLACG